MRRAVRVLALLALVPCSTTASAADKNSKPPALHAVRHGSQITQALVGPAAAGLSPGKTAGSVVLRDGDAHEFARSIPARASYDGRVVEGPHLLIERVRFDGNLDIYTRLPVVMRGVHIELARSAHWGLQTRPGAGPLYFLWSEVSGPTGDPRTSAVGVAMMLRANGALVYRSRLHGTVDGIQPSGSDIRVIESLIDGLVAAPGAHNDGIQILGAPSRIAIVRSRIVNANPQTSVIAIGGRDVLVEANRLSGGGWTIYGGAAKRPGSAPQPFGVRVIGNVIGRDVFLRGGHFGAVTSWSGFGNTWRDNRFSTGETLRP